MTRGLGPVVTRGSGSGAVRCSLYCGHGLNSFSSLPLPLWLRHTPHFCAPSQLQAYTSQLQPITCHKLWNDVRVSASLSYAVLLGLCLASSQVA